MNKPAELAIAAQVQLPVERGTYALLLRITARRRWIVGKLGPREFPEGYYLYLGSALNGLETRLRRHLRRDKKPHWHIDVLTNAEPLVRTSGGPRAMNAGNASGRRRRWITPEHLSQSPDSVPPTAAASPIWRVFPAGLKSGPSIG